MRDTHGFPTWESGMRMLSSGAGYAWGLESIKTRVRRGELICDITLQYVYQMVWTRPVIETSRSNYDHGS